MKHIDATMAGNKISMYIADGSDHDPQTMAMLQAFYSRSTKSIADRVEGMTAEQVQQSLLKYYLGYGHRSIGQCGNFVMFIEDVSIFAAKAIQHHPLYNGQETSTRYYDFCERPFINPLGVEGIESALRDLYRRVLGLAETAYLEEAKAENHCIDANMKRTISAKAFDLARGILTAGFTTKLSWSSTFDQAHDRISALVNSGVEELHVIGDSLASALHEKYPSAFPELISMLSDYAEKMPLFDDTARLRKAIISRSADPCAYGKDTVHAVCALRKLGDDPDAVNLLKSRKRGEPVPRSFAQYGTFDFAFRIDYASFRDIHRHRNCTMYFPHYDPSSLVVHDWYLREMDRLNILAELTDAALTVKGHLDYIYDDLVPQAEKIAASRYGAGTDAYHAALMYYIPMGTCVTGVLSCDLPQAMYLSELRSSRTVHPTARSVARDIAAAVQAHLPPEVPLYVDTFDKTFASARGKQTIHEKGNLE